MDKEPRIPPTSELIGIAKKRLKRTRPGLLDPESIRNNFSDAVEGLFQATYEEYAECERERVEDIISGTAGKMKKGFTEEDVTDMIRQAVHDAILMEKSFKQSRASRAGRAFELIVADLLAEIGVRSEPVTKEDRKVGLRRIDRVVPDRNTAIKTPDKAHFLSLKTSLRERWMQVAEEQTQGQRTHLLTLLQKETLSNEVARKITDRGIFLYVPDRVKNDRFPENPRIRGLSDIPGIVGS